MRVAIFFISPNGTTRKSASMLKAAFEARNHQVLLVDIGKTRYRDDAGLLVEFQKCDIAGFGAPVYHMDMLKPMADFMQRVGCGTQQKAPKAFVFINYAGLTSGKSFLNAFKTLVSVNIDVVGALKLYAPHFHQKKDFPFAETETTINDFVRELAERNFQPLSLKSCGILFKPDKLRVNLIYPFAHILGKRRQIPISIDTERCTGCKRCEAECPVEAISVPDGTAVIDFDKCVHCYHCMLACNFHAVNAEVDRLDKMIRLNRRVIGMERPLNKIYINNQRPN